MRTLFKTTDLIRFLYNIDCEATAEDIKSRANGAEFVDSKVVRELLIDELYEALNETVTKYTYLCK
jgi:hypothetical protein